MARSRVIEYTFFFASLVAVGYLLWLMLAPFITALALAAVVVIICYPVFNFILRYVTRGRRGLAALLASTVVLSLVVAPVVVLSMVLVNEFLSLYRSLEGGSLQSVDLLVSDIESQVQLYVPGFEFNISDQTKQTVRWITGNIGGIFAGTLSLIVSLFIAILATFYLFKDGPRLMAWVVAVSPLKDSEDSTILSRLSQSVRSVATGTVLVALLQGALAATGFAVFGIDRPLLWGTVAAVFALLPGIGTLVIMVPGMLYLSYLGEYIAAGGLALWALATVLIVDNIISPYLMSRGNNMHPLVVLLAVLGGLSVFGPLGFILGPVVVSLFLVLLEVYSSYAEGGTITETTVSDSHEVKDSEKEVLAVSPRQKKMVTLKTTTVAKSTPKTKSTKPRTPRTPKTPVVREENQEIETLVVPAVKPRIRKVATTVKTRTKTVVGVR